MTSLRVNAASLNRPGVFVSQDSTNTLPQPIANHAIAYIFGTTPAEEYYGEDAINTFSPLEPYKPTQIASVDDFVSKIGGVAPTANMGALVSYDSVKGFFDNVGVNGILYFTRVSPTPETYIDLSASGAGAGYNAFAIKVNGRYFGTSIGVADSEGDDIKIITTTALDAADNARDLYEFLSAPGTESDNFSDFYRVEQTATEALGATFRIFSKDTRNIPKVDKFFAYNFSDTTYATPLNLDTPQVVKLYTSVKQLDFRCVARDVATKEPILYISGSQLSLFIQAANADTPGTYDPTTDQSVILKDFLVYKNVYASQGAIPNGKIIAVSKDLSSGVGAGDKWPDASAAYWKYDAPLLIFGEISSGGNPVVPTGTISNVGGVQTRTGYLPDTVQVFYVSVAGENRAIIVNGATPDELADELRREIVSILAEKNLDQYYTVEAIASNTNLSGDTYVPNNGHIVSDLVSEAGAPYIRPEVDDIVLSGLITVSNGAVSGVGTKFTTELSVGDIIVANGIRFTISGVSSDTAATVTPNTVNITTATSYSLDKSLPNGFYSFDYVLSLKITSNNGVVSPILPGANRFGVIDSNVVKLVSIDQNAGYESYKLTQTAKAHDFVYAMEQGMGSRFFSPGFVLAPEAYAVLTYNADGGPTNDLQSKSEARQERLKITQTLNRIAQGSVGATEGLTATQHIALIDCGGDEDKVNEVQDELYRIKAVVGVPFGHSAYYAPYVRNLDDRLVPPSAFVAGIACSRYVNEGFQQPPAGARYPLRGVNGLKFDISAQQQEVTYALGLNPIRSLPNRGIVTWGARTLSTNPLFRFVNTRAILNVLIDVMSRSFDDILFDSIDSAGTIFARVKSISNQVLNQFYRQGALFGSRAEQAYLSVCSSANNDATSLEQGNVNLDVYVATSPTLERIPIRITRTPVGQVVQLADSFSRNEERFSAFLSASNL